MIRIACCSDSHGCPPEAVDETDILAWLHAGDLINGDDAHSLQAILPWIRARQIPIRMVRGNHDCALTGRGFHDMDISGRVVQLRDGLFVAGVGWTSRVYYEVPGESDLEPICRSVARQALRMVMPHDRLVLVTHYPPALGGLFEPAFTDAGHAFACVRQLVEEVCPLVIIQGHVHEWFGKTATVDLRGQPCLIVNPGPRGAIVNLPDDGPVSCTFA